MLHWNDIRDQERALDVLRRALETDRLHHGYLFVGPQGVGKRATALALAEVLNCEARQPKVFADACGTCPSCRKIGKLQHPDLHLVEAEGRTLKTIKIAQVREIQKAASTRPYEARYQVVIIDDAHLMGDEAANALLKTLEEPPSTMRLILTTDQPHRLLDTIRSRCQTVRFGALAESTVVDLLLAQGEALMGEGEPVPSGALVAVAAAFGEGSVGRAAEVLTSGLLDARRELVEQIGALDPSRPAELLDAAEGLAKDRGAFDPKLDLLKVVLRDVLVLKASGNPDRLVNRDLEPLIEGLAGRLSVDALMNCLERLAKAQELVGRNVNTQLVAEDLLQGLAEAMGGARFAAPPSL